MQTDHNNYFRFEKLDAYQLAVQVNRQVASASWPTGRAHLKDQAIRAADSMVLNLAEGVARGRQSNAGKNHIRIARGSAGEVFAVVDILKMGDSLKRDLQRIGAMLFGLS